MSIRRSTIIQTIISKGLEFKPAEIVTSTFFKTELRRSLEFPFDENYNFSYLLCEDGFFFLQENGSKIILE
jgi:hypothetical protein